jgi:hypothetical protein
MQRFTPEQRRFYADHLCELIREWVVDRDGDFEMDLQRGVEWCREPGAEGRTPRPNPTITLTLRINGGARETEGPPVVRTPPLYRGPAG